ncbi:hypothetical protein [Streptomyces sp. NPDC019890]|uniref:hypothetical protein n=1 Tax=Streptomyces sp. NPDC019890 TaxID=3365064 RepID=UPI00384C9045
MAVAPFAATVGGLVLPATAHAADRPEAAAPEPPLPIPSSVSVKIRTHAEGEGEHPTDYPATIEGLKGERSGLAGAVHYERVVLAESRAAWRTGKWMPNVGKGLFPRVSGRGAFRWDRDDFKDPDWRPQGITSEYDARLTGDPYIPLNRNVLMVSWYGRRAQRERGARITFVDLKTRQPRYVHVLLVEPVNGSTRPGGSGRPHDFRAADVHAGGIAWYRNRLYVADSKKRALRVFNLDEMIRVAPGGNKRLVGFHGGRYHAYDYTYILPQSRAYDHVVQDWETERTRLGYSQVAVVHTDGRSSLLVSEFRRAEREGNKPRPAIDSRIIDWTLNSAGALTDGGNDAEIASRRVYRIRNGGNVQGAVSAGGRFHLSVSDGFANGKLNTCPVDGTATEKWEQVPGPEDLSYQSNYRGSRVIWGLGEYAKNDQDSGATPPEKIRTRVNSRYVYAMRL